MTEGEAIFYEKDEQGDGDWADYDAENDAPISIYGKKTRYVMTLIQRRTNPVWKVVVHEMVKCAHHMPRSS